VCADPAQPMIIAAGSAEIDSHRKRFAQEQPLILRR
jgi:hypothetical protein